MIGKNLIKTAMLLLVMALLFMLTGWLIGGTGGLLIALIAAIASNGFAWWNSGKLVRRMQNARQLSRSQAPELFGMTEQLAMRAEIPMPALYVMESDQPNAFATGRNPENAAICISTGLLRTLDRDELAGVIAHEMAHIRNRDTMIMTYTATMAGAISMLSQYVFWFAGGRRDGPLGGLGILVAAIVAPIAALIIRMFVSRTREYEADRIGAHISGDPMALASALQKISAVAKRTVLNRARRHPAHAHMFIFNPLTGGKGVDSWFSTHPAVENRVAQLVEIARKMGLQAPEPVSRIEAPAARSGQANPWQ